jgi:hypothetical protein
MRTRNAIAAWLLSCLNLPKTARGAKHFLRYLVVRVSPLALLTFYLQAPVARSQARDGASDLKMAGTVWRVPFHRGKKQWTVPFKFMTGGTCTYADYKLCTWSQDGASVTITLDKPADSCPAVWNATIDGDTLEVTVHQRSTFSCQAATYDTTLYRSH